MNTCLLPQSSCLWVFPFRPAGGAIVYEKPCFVSGRYWEHNLFGLKKFLFLFIIVHAYLFFLIQHENNFVGTASLHSLNLSLRRDGVKGRRVKVLEISESDHLKRTGENLCLLGKRMCWTLQARNVSICISSGQMAKEYYLLQGISFKMVGLVFD